ncbi:MAG: hypothetical protein L3J32_04610, partial [Rhizobiaceae bacterium]|nr:hypothetical protein [Rhizobiaceae bacterium]
MRNKKPSFLLGKVSFFPALSFIAFVAMGVLDTKVTYQYRLKKQLKITTQTEIDYLNRDFSPLQTGVQFKNPKHFYSNDLDIFGKESLFQAVNRTVTKEGKI